MGTGSGRSVLTPVSRAIEPLVKFNEGRAIRDGWPREALARAGAGAEVAERWRR